MNQIVENLKDLGPKRLALLGGIGLAITAAVFIGARTILAPTYVPVYSQLSPGTASQMMQTLEQAGLTVDLSRNGCGKRHRPRPHGIGRCGAAGRRCAGLGDFR